MSDIKGTIVLAHGSGGRMMHDLIEKLFLKHFGNSILNDMTDAALLSVDSEQLAFTTDSYVIDPLFFPGGNIGKLAVCGTVNDLAVSGAIPMYLSASFIIEEGFPINDLEIIAQSMADEAARSGVKIVTGDTKVVNRGKCDKLFINTSGIGKITEGHLHVSKALNIRPGDAVIINGTIGDHGMAVMNARESFNFRSSLGSDCASLNHMISEVLYKAEVKFMRDPTRGGVATVLNELAAKINLGIEIEESNLPVRNSVRAMCEVLGFDPLHVANEGKVIMVSDEKNARVILESLKGNEYGRDALVIGRIVDTNRGRVVLRTLTGGHRFVESLAGDQLPRIC
jgi:hydrogenase expression/formation protein HypE